MSIESPSHQRGETPDPRKLPVRFWDPTVEFRQIPTSEVLDLLWRGEHAAIEGFHATDVNADVSKEGRIKKARLDGQTQENGEEYKTWVTVTMPSMFMRFINRYKPRQLEAKLQVDTHLIPNSTFEKYST